MKKEKLEPLVIRISKKDRELLELISSSDNTSMSDIAREFIKIGLSISPYQDLLLPKIDTKDLEK